MTNQAESLERLTQVVTEALAEMKAVNVTVLDVKAMTSISDVMIVASGTSTRHVKSLADSVVEKAKANGFAPLGVEGTDKAEWVLVDLNAIIVHIMTPASREFYDLERLWSVAPTNSARQDEART